ncbi:MAG: STAS/SEC14 domain-containing protein [Xenococcaceae cyanobacterium]
MTIKLIPHKPDKIVGLNIDGKIEAQDIDLVVKSIEQKLKLGGKLRIYAEVNNWSGMSLEAFIKDLKFSLQHLQDFEKEAIVSDRRWLESLAALGNTLFSSIEVKHFTFADKDKALEWIGS